MIMPCTCKNEFQDRAYGRGRRVHNPCKFEKSGNVGGGQRCTVCGDVKRTWGGGEDA